MVNYMNNRVALLFWGLTRGLKYTQSSIVNNVIMPLRRNGYEVDVFIHTYYFEGTYSNSRHGIENMKLDFTEYRLLNPKYSILEDQDEIKKKLRLRRYRTKKDHFKNNYQSNDFYILSLHSQGQVTRLFNQHKDEYRFCIFLRPDVIYVKPLNIGWLTFVGKNSMVIPGWSNYKNKKEHSENDRFCICHPDDASKYGDVLDYLLPYSKYEPIVAEFFIGFVLNKFFKVNLHRVKFIFKRVLPNGQIMPLDGKLR